MKRKMKSIFMIALMMHSCFISMNCMTVESYKGNNPEDLQYSVEDIKSIQLKSGEMLQLEDSQFRFVELTNDSVYAFLINAFDTAWSANKLNYSVSSVWDTVKLSEVKKIFVNETNVGLTVLLVVGITLLALVIGVIIYFAAHPLKFTFSAN
jgi:hypothetical protein